MKHINLRSEVNCRRCGFFLFLVKKRFTEQDGKIELNLVMFLKKGLLMTEKPCATKVVFLQGFNLIPDGRKLRKLVFNDV